MVIGSKGYWRGTLCLLFLLELQQLAQISKNTQILKGIIHTQRRLNILFRRRTICRIQI